MNPQIKARLAHVASNVRLLEKFSKIFLAEISTSDEVLRDLGVVEDTENEEDECDMSLDPMDCGMDDGSVPAGPRNEPNKSIYQVSPGHGQSTVDMFTSVA